MDAIQEAVKAMNRIHAYWEQVYKWRMRKALQAENVSIISNDCWGSQAYKYVGLPYPTPFVGLFMMASCYVSLLSDLENQLAISSFEFIEESKYDSSNKWRKANKKGYPIRPLNGLFEVHFLHYKTTEEAEETWNRRRLRINFSNLAIKFDGSKDEASKDSINSVEKFPFSKKLILDNSANFKGTNQEVLCSNWIMDGAKMFRISHQEFDFIDWVNSGVIHKTLFSKTMDKIVVSRSNQLL